MQLNNNHIIPDNSKGNVQDYREYQIDKVIYNINREFDDNNTLKELLLQKILSEKSIVY